MQYKFLQASQVTLDPDNPRLHDGTSSDREAINRLLDEGADGLINLARDMAQTGQANPSDLPIAIKSGSKYLVLEGNRRFAALKLLKDPVLANDPDHQKAFQRAAKLGTPPKTIYALVMEIARKQTIGLFFATPERTAGLELDDGVRHRHKASCRAGAIVRTRMGSPLPVRLPRSGTR